MKKVIKSGLLFSVIFLLLFECLSVAQVRIKKAVTPRSHLREYVMIEGGVKSFLNCKSNKQSLVVLFDTLKLKPGSRLKIRGVSINGMNIPKGSDGRYSLYKNPYNCPVGKVLEIKVKLEKKAANSIRPQIIAVLIGKFRVRNLFKRYLFPRQDSTIDLARLGDTLAFKWQFTSSPVPSLVALTRVGSPPSQVWMKKASGVTLKFAKNTLSSGMEYKIVQETKAKPFSLTNTAHKSSQINFFSGIILTFKTK